MTKKKIYSKDLQESIVKDYLNLISIDKLSLKYNISTWGVKSILKDNNIDKRTPGEARSKYNFNQAFFEKIDTEEKAYWLGFLYADGSVSKSNNTLRIMLKNDDKIHLEKLKKSINSNHPLFEYTMQKKYKCISLTLTHPKTKQDLINLGCVSNKSLILKFPTKEQVPDEFIFHFIRGYFDGDGSITYDSKRKRYGLSVLGTEDFLKEMLFHLKLDYKIYFSKTSKIHYISILSKPINEYILDMMYSNATIYLDRKYERYNKFKQSL